MPRGLGFALIVIALSARASAQEPEIEALLDRMGAYLQAYEEALGAVVADEMYEQRTTQPGPRQRVEADPTGQPIVWGPSRMLVQDRRLQSIVSFMRLPGGAAWLGTREVHTIDGRHLASRETLLSILTSEAGDARWQAAAIAQASAQHNLGNTRTVNMPTLPLALLDPLHRDRMTFRVTGRDSMRGVRATRMAFEERGAPTLIKGERDGRWVIARGVVWIESATGAIWRAHVFYRDYVPGLTSRAPEAELHVDFMRHAALGLVVPEKMREVFHVDSGRGEGEAKYSNFRRFTTSARILPPSS